MGKFRMYNPDKECNKLCQRIRKLCKLKNISNYMLSQKASLSTSTVHSILVGNTRPQIYTLFQICNALEISVCDLLDDYESNYEVENVEANWKERNETIGDKEDKKTKQDLCEKRLMELTDDEFKIIFYLRHLSEHKRKLLEIYLNMLFQYTENED